MTLSMAGYVVNDALIKLTTETIPVFQAIFLRGLVVVAIFMVAAARMRLIRDLRSHFGRPLALRVSMETVGTVLFLNALTHAPLAGLTAVLQIVPVAMTFIAARLLRESVSLHRVASVVVGFVGVLIIIRPGSSDFNPWLLVGLVVVVGIIIRELATTRIPVDTPSVIVSLAAAASITAVGGIGSLAEGWSTVSGTNAIRLSAAACFIAIGYLASVVTVRVGDLSFSAPFRYTIMVFAIALQIVVFNDVPDALTFAGTALIIAAGLYAFRSETRAARLVSQPTKLRF